MKSLLTRCLVIAACSVSASAMAQMDTAPPDIQGECSADADCPTGFTCEAEEIGVCSACADGEMCEPSCTTEVYSYCSPPPPTPCAADSDCGEGDVCVSYTYETCGDIAIGAPTCAADEPCPEPIMPEPMECESITEAYCVPKYFAPCQVDADCGGGFTCEQSEICGCSGGAPDDPSLPDMGSTEPDCSCAPSGDSYCRLIEVECATDADCASGLTCQDGYGETSVVDPDDGSGTDPMPSPDPAPAVSYCAPVGYGYWGGPAGNDVIANEAGVTSDAELASADRISWGENGPSGSGSKGSTSACSTTGGDASLTLLGLIGLFGFLRRR